MEWKKHYEFTNYAADSSCRVKNIETNVIINPTFVRNNIYVMNLYKDGVKKKFHLHIFVYECFYGPIPEGRRVTFWNKDWWKMELGNLKLNDQNITYYKPRRQYRIEIRGQEFIFNSLKKASESLNIPIKNLKNPQDGMIVTPW